MRSAAVRKDHLNFALNPDLAQSGSHPHPTRLTQRALAVTTSANRWSDTTCYLTYTHHACRHGFTEFHANRTPHLPTQIAKLSADFAQLVVAIQSHQLAAGARTMPKPAQLAKAKQSMHTKPLHSRKVAVDLFSSIETGGQSVPRATWTVFFALSLFCSI